MNTKVVYIADIDQDIDDIVAVEYLNNLGVLQEIVLDPKPSSKEGRGRVELLKKQGIKVSENIPQGTAIVFVGGALTAVTNYLRFGGKLNLLVINGGFVGDNIVPRDNQLQKFKGKKFVRTFNFNIDVFSTAYVLKSKESQVKKIVLVGKNVCHSIKNTKLGIWKKSNLIPVLEKYHVREDKRQHDVLMCHEGLAISGLSPEPLFCAYEEVYPTTLEGLKGNMTQWGSTKNIKNTEYRMVISAVRFQEQEG